MYQLLSSIQKGERKLEEVLISTERKIENWLLSWMPQTLGFEGMEKDWVPKDLKEPYRTYHFMTHPKPGTIEIDPRYKGKTGLKINLGAGQIFKSSAPDWITLDICEHGDCRGTDININIGSSALPFEDNSVDIAYSSHTLEHMNKAEAVFLINELSRVMSPKGIVRIVCPDLELAVKAYTEGDKKFFWERWSHDSWRKWNQPISLRGGIETLSPSECLSYEVSCLNNSGRTSHVNAFDNEYLSILFKDSGFKYTLRSTANNSVIPEMRADHFDDLREIYKTFSLYFEASKETDLAALTKKDEMVNKPVSKQQVEAA